MLHVSFDEQFLTSDWPCFDLKDDPNEPLLGEEIGRERNVALFFPLNPLVLGTFVHPQFTPEASIARQPVVKLMSKSEVRNANGLIIQRADEFVGASTQHDFVFQVAGKRKQRSDGPSANTDA